MNAFTIGARETVFAERRGKRQEGILFKWRAPVVRSLCAICAIVLFEFQVDLSSPDFLLHERNRFSLFSIVNTHLERKLQPTMIDYESASGFQVASSWPARVS